MGGDSVESEGRTAGGVDLNPCTHFGFSLGKEIGKQHSEYRNLATNPDVGGGFSRRTDDRGTIFPLDSPSEKPAVLAVLLSSKLQKGSANVI